jgi:photosystem II stability/assembly factor-like uncharacterized protein
MPSAAPHRLATLALVLILALRPGPAPAHDASAWGGLFRTRDAGTSWLHINPASFVSGALALAISRADPHHLLLATDTGVARSRNGGRDWVIEAPDILVGPAFAAAFDVDGERALVSGASAIFRGDGHRWRRLRSPAGSAPARALVSASIRGRVYLAGRTGFYRSDDWGQSWVSLGDALQAEHVSRVVVPRGRADEVYVVAGGRSWVSTDAGRTWQLRVDGLPRGGIEAVAVDPSDANRLWSVVADQVFRSDDQGRRWRPVGEPVPERPVAARGLAVVDHVILMATDRGVFRSPDDGGRWTLASDSLPAHLPAGLLVRDPEAPATVYAGFALTSPEELSRRAAEASGVLGRMAPGALAGGLVVLALLLLAAGAVVRRLARTYHPASRSVPP